MSFNTQPPEGGWIHGCNGMMTALLFQHTAARRRLDTCLQRDDGSLVVSTHSRPKAAGVAMCYLIPRYFGFNTQPPEGGWALPNRSKPSLSSFNTQPPEGGWLKRLILIDNLPAFQHTAARRRLASKSDKWRQVVLVSTHSRPKAAGTTKNKLWKKHCCFNTQPPEGGW